MRRPVHPIKVPFDSLDKCHWRTEDLDELTQAPRVLLTTFSPLATESTCLFPLCLHFLTFLFHCRQSRFVDVADPCLIRLSSEIVPRIRKLIDCSPETSLCLIRRSAFWLRIQVFRDVTLCHRLSDFRRFEGASSFIFTGRAVRTEFTGCHARF